MINRELIHLDRNMKDNKESVNKESAYLQCSIMDNLAENIEIITIVQKEINDLNDFLFENLPAENMSLCMNLMLDLKNKVNQCQLYTKIEIKKMHNNIYSTHDLVVMDEVNFVIISSIIRSQNQMLYKVKEEVKSLRQKRLISRGIYQKALTFLRKIEM